MKKLIITIFATFAAIWVSDFFIHQVLLSSSYAATPSRWRSGPEMLARMHWMFIGQFIIAIGIATIYVKAMAEKACIKCATAYGFCIGLISAGAQIIMYAVAPYPGSLVAKWCIAYTAQGVFLGLVLFLVCKPAVPKA